MKHFVTSIPNWCPKGFTLFHLHCAVNLHFLNKGYDFFKYHGKTRTNVKTFNSYQFKWQYAKLEQDLLTLDRDFLYPLYMLTRKHDYQYVPITKFSIVELSQLTKTSNDLILWDIERDLDIMRREHGEIRRDLGEIGQLHPILYELGKKYKFCMETYLCYDMFIAPIFDPNASIDKILWPEVCKQAEQLRGFVTHLVEESDFARLVDQFQTKQA